MDQVEMIKGNEVMDWEMVRLDEVCQVLGGTTPSTTVADYWDGDVIWLSPVDLPEVGTISEVQNSKRKITERGLKECSLSLLPVGSVVFSTRASIGKIGIVKTPLCTNQGFTNFIPGNRITSEYLAYALKVNIPNIEKLGNTTTFKEVSRSAIRGIQIPLPPLETQNRIAAILDKADALRRKDQELLQKYDDLAQAIFMDMFGDPVKNEKGWEEVEIINCCSAKDDVRCGPFGTQLLQNEFVTSGVPLWGIRHTNSGFKKPTHEFLTIEKAKELQNYSILKGDIVMTRKGTIGNCSVYEFEEDGVMHSDLLRLRVNTNICNPYFLSYQFKHSLKLINQIEQISHGAIMSGINVSKLKTLNVLLPPVKLQNQFKESVDNIALSINIIQLRTCESLFQSLLQKAFTGELVP